MSSRLVTSLRSANLPIGSLDRCAASIIGAVTDRDAESVNELTRRLTRRTRRYVHRSDSAVDVLLRLCEPAGSARAETISLVALLREAAHQADLAREPYVSVDHLRRAAARLRGDRARWESFVSARAGQWTPPRSRWWPRGRHSAARRAGQERLVEAYEEALRVEMTRAWPVETE